MNTVALFDAQSGSQKVHSWLEFKIIFNLRYFGANTIWYLQFHLLCAKL